MEHKIKLDYQAMNDLANALLTQANELDGIGDTVQSIASQMIGGALVGVAGDAFSNDITGKLLPAIKNLSDAIKSTGQDIQAAVQDMQSQDAQAGSEFKG
jgi:WXG100 family type VII secretion target